MHKHRLNMNMHLCMYKYDSDLHTPMCALLYCPHWDPLQVPLQIYSPCR